VHNRSWRLGALWLLLGPATLTAQSSAALVADGDRLHATDATSALAKYRQALSLDSSSAQTFMKVAATELDLGEFAPTKSEQITAYATAERLARRARAMAPEDPDVAFVLARALGRTALALGPRDRIKYGTEIHDLCVGALVKAPKHPGLLHVLAMWHAEVMRLNRFERFFARTVLGGQVLASANWDEAQRLLETAVAVDPVRAVHRLDLAKIYLDRGESVRARAQLDTARSAPRIDYNDPEFKAQAESLYVRLASREPSR
jgi:Tfp pilus assembly protein PilF